MSNGSTTSTRVGALTLPSRGGLGHRALVAARVLLAIAFAGGGVIKLAGAESMVEMFADIGAGQWLRYVVGGLEVAGAVGLLIPRLSGLAALGLCGLMVGATFTRAVVLDGPPVIEVLFLMALAAIARERKLRF